MKVHRSDRGPIMIDALVSVVLMLSTLLPRRLEMQTSQVQLTVMQREDALSTMCM